MKRERSESGKYVCPCCGFASLDAANACEVCKICYWEDDGQDDPSAEEFWGAPNFLSLTEARINFLKIGANAPKDVRNVRAPEQTDENIRNYKLVDDKAVADQKE